MSAFDTASTDEVQDVRVCISCLIKPVHEHTPAEARACLDRLGLAEDDEDEQR